MHLGAAFHEKKKRVLVIDADGQNTLIFTGQAPYRTIRTESRFRW